MKIKAALKKVTRKRQKFVFGLLVASVAVVTMGAGCDLQQGEKLPPGSYGPSLKSVGEDINHDVSDVVEAHKEVGRSVGDWFGKWSKGWSEADASRKRHKAPRSDDTPSQAPACKWAEFGPCDEAPPLEYFGITDDNMNGVNDADE